MVRRGLHAYHDFSQSADSDLAINQMEEYSNYNVMFDPPDQVFAHQRIGQEGAKPQQSGHSNGVPVNQVQQMNLNKSVNSGAHSNSHARPSTGTNSHHLVNKIPAQPLPTTLSIGGHAREPIPLLPEERNLAQLAVDETNGGVFHTFQDPCPPPADALFSVVDQGVSGPQFFRLSMYNIPVTEKLRASTQLPLALYLRPFALKDVPLADFSRYSKLSDSMPPRCRRCRAYMNPSMRFIHGGARFVCNLCLFENETPGPYYQPLNHENRRIDWAERPELAYGTYDFVVSSNDNNNDNNGDNENGSGSGYSSDAVTGGFSSVNGPSSTNGAVTSIYGPPSTLFRHIFCCECSRDSVQKSLIITFAEAVRESLPHLARNTKVAICLFNSQIVHFRFASNGVQMMVSSPGFSAVPPDIFVDPHDPEQLENLLNLLKKLPELYDETNTHDRRSCFGDCLQSFETLSDFNAGGRITVVCSGLPSRGASKLTMRDSAIAGITPPDGPTNKQLFNTTSAFYKNLATSFNTNGWACDILAIPFTGYLDLANIGHISQQTGGKLLYYPRFTADRDMRRVVADILAIATLPLHARHTQLKIRTCNGIQVAECDYEPALKQGFMDTDTTVCVTMKYDGYLDPKLDAHFQAAVLYTAESGERRVRVFNHLAGVSSRPKLILKHIDADVVYMTIIRQTLPQLGQHSSKELRSAVLKKVESIFGALRKLVGQGMPQQQLLMPVNLRSLIIYMLAFTKSVALGSRSFSSDSRVSSAIGLARSYAELLCVELYPRMYELDKSNPIAVRAQFEVLQNNVLPVLIFDGTHLYLWISEAVMPSTLMDLFGVSELNLVSPWLDELEVFDNELSRTARDLCTKLAGRISRSWVHLQVVRQNLDGAELQLRQLMVEDTVNESPSYLNYISKVHEYAKNACKEDSGWF